MIITIDGRSGAGKTTQSEIIGKHLNLPVCNFSLATRVITDVHNVYIAQNKSGINPFLPALFEYQTTSQRYKRTVIEECLFYPFFYYDTIVGFNDWELVDWYFETIGVQGGIYPTASFYLHVDESFAISSRINRKFNISTNNLKPNTIQLDFWENLAERVPFLHIINGMQSKENVTADILNILKENRCV